MQSNVEKYRNQRRVGFMLLLGWSLFFVVFALIEMLTDLNGLSGMATGLVLAALAAVIYFRSAAKLRQAQGQQPQAGPESTPPV